MIFLFLPFWLNLLWPINYTNKYCVHEITGKILGMIIMVVWYCGILLIIILYIPERQVYKYFSTAEALMICSIGSSCENFLADSALEWKVQAGSPSLSFHAALQCPSVPLQNNHLQPSTCLCCTTKAIPYESGGPLGRSAQITKMKRVNH